MAGGNYEGPSYGTGNPVDPGTGANLGPLPGLFGSSGLGLAGLGAEAGGLGLSLFGAFSQANTAKEESDVSIQKAQIEQQQNQVKWNQAQMGLRRSNLQVLRNDQQSRSIALTNAVSGTGTTKSSEYGGALGQISGETNTGLQGLQQSYDFGLQQKNLNDQLSQNEIQMAGLESKKASQSIFSSLGSGLTSIGGSAVSAATGSGGLSSLLPLLALA